MPSFNGQFVQKSSLSCIRLAMHLWALRGAKQQENVGVVSPKSPNVVTDLDFPYQPIDAEASPIAILIVLPSLNWPVPMPLATRPYPRA